MKTEFLEGSIVEPNETLKANSNVPRPSTYNFCDRKFAKSVEMRLQSLQCCFSKGVYAFSLVVVSFSSLELILVYSSGIRAPDSFGFSNFSYD